FYAARLPSVEINNTFYRMPRAETLEGWAAQVPEAFRFAVKTPRRITHSKQLRDCAEEAVRFFDTLGALGPRLGCVLVQLPPHARADADTLARFLDLVPEGISAAFEFRHASWREERVLAALRARNAAWVTADTDGSLPAGLPETGNWSYLRLRAPGYDDAALRAWKALLAGLDRAFVYFKHEDDAAGPAFAARMMEL